MKKLWLLALFVCIPVHAQEKILTFGIVPQQSAITLAKNWGPILEKLSEDTGYKIVFRTAKNIPEFEQRVLNGEYDIAYMNPYHYTVFHQKPGYQAFAKQQDKRIRGIIVVKKDSNITDLKQLDGETLVFPSPAAFAASVIPRSSLKAMGINITPQYVSSHDSVYLNVVKGLFPAGGGIERTLNNTDNAVRNDLKVLWRTPDYTPHAFATHPDLPKEVSDKVSRAMLALNDTDAGKTLLSRIKFKGIEAAQNEDWDDVRALNITLLDKLLEQ
ncbi:phosphate/phosphite/phosphonate ABC transporter substrate-binding protein [Vibrio hepatarius]|uniref:phosphate/phosphite/phosphonate ABC transporter substrate-binding protein n=1 Tax=Vibrio hepatarius TaxID=171383 RepID=UPI00148BCD72|nr:phosphate/phosphite/phosphonate ABC transporter substrate-binding protein [Vibrio hepatarius]NOI15527.1 phosphate/phosphite/phosphonate ABC transporter substrate-binding protein [Vibrio hepatarius]